MSTTDQEEQVRAGIGQLYDALLRLRDGDFSVRLPTPAQWNGGVGRVVGVFNSLARLLEELSGEFVRITDEVGKQGMFGGQAEVYGISGRWREMHDSLNRMAERLTLEVRATSQTAQAWAEGDASKRLEEVLIPGEVAEMKQQLNAAAERWAGASPPGSAPAGKPPSP
jgi:hypothetical protein